MLALFRVTFGGLMLLKVLDIAARGHNTMPLVAFIPTVVLWTLAGIGIVLDRRTRVAAATILVLTFVVVIVPKPTMHSHHLYLILSICVILIMHVEAPLLLRAQLSIVYGFAALAKVNEAFLSGTVIHNAAAIGPFGHAIPDNFGLLASVSAMAVLTESFLAAGFWFARTRRVALWTGLALHLSMALLMASSFVALVQLLVYGGLMAALYLAFFEPQLDGWAARRERVESAAFGAAYFGTGGDRTRVPASSPAEGVLSG